MFFIYLCCMFKKKWWIFWVLASFTWLLLPRDAWHSCEPAHEAHHDHFPGEKYFEKGDCFICDFELYTSTIHKFQVFRFEHISHPEFKDLAESQLSAPLHQTLSRGPPAIA